MRKLSLGEVDPGWTRLQTQVFLLQSLTSEQLCHTTVRTSECSEPVIPSSLSLVKG